MSGLSGVEWDAVELPSQFMENFCWEWEVLQRLSAHVDSGEPLPRELFDKLLAAKNFHSGLRMLRQVEYALFDLRIHREPDAAPRARQQSPTRCATQVARAAGGRVQPLCAQFFTHLRRWLRGRATTATSGLKYCRPMCGAPSRKPACSTPKRAVATAQNILEVGGSRSAMDNFMAFRGREPRIDALAAPPGHGLSGRGATFHATIPRHCEHEPPT